VRISSIGSTLAASFALAFFFAPAAGADEGTPPGPVVVTQAAPDALLLWDASAMVTQLTDAKTTPTAALATLEAGAMRIATHYAPTLAHAKNVSVQVLYANTSYINPTYPTTVYAGTVRLLSVTLTVDDAVKNGAHFADQLGSGTVPDGVKVVVQGSLPEPKPS
jgi:hypothetical protein